MKLMTGERSLLDICFITSNILYYLKAVSSMQYVGITASICASKRGNWKWEQKLQSEVRMCVKTRAEETSLHSLMIRREPQHAWRRGQGSIPRQLWIKAPATRIKHRTSATSDCSVTPITNNHYSRNHWLSCTQQFWALFGFHNTSSFRLVKKKTIQIYIFIALYL